MLIDGLNPQSQGEALSHGLTVNPESSRSCCEGWVDPHGEVVVEVPALISAAGHTPDSLYRATVSEAVVPQLSGVAVGGVDCPHACVPVFSCSDLSGLGYVQRVQRLLAATAARLNDRFSRSPPDVVAVLRADSHRVGRVWHANRQAHQLSPGEFRLLEAMPGLLRSNWWSVPFGYSPLSVLCEAAQAIVAGGIDSVLIVGVDACAADAVVADPGLSQVRRNLSQSGGLAPADAAGFVLLRRRKINKVGASAARLVSIPSRASQEQDAVDGGSTSLVDGNGSVQGLGVIRCAAPVKNTSLVASWVACLDSLLGALPRRWDVEVSMLGAFAAEQAVVANLRRSLDVLRRPPQTERIAAWRGLGFAGAAGLPLLLAVALGRLADGKNPIDRVLALCGGAGANGAGGVVIESAAAAEEML